MSRKNQSIFPRQWAEVAVQLPPAMRLALFDALCLYVIDGTMPKADNPAYGAFLGFMQDIKCAQARQAEISAKRAEAGKKGMANRWNNKITNDNKNNKCYSDITKITNVTDVITNVTNDNKNNKKSIPPYNPPINNIIINKQEKEGGEVARAHTREEEVKEPTTAELEAKELQWLADYTKPKNQAKIEQLAMSLHFESADEMRKVAGDIVNRWLVEHEYHPDYKAFAVRMSQSLRAYKRYEPTHQQNNNAPATYRSSISPPQSRAEYREKMTQSAMQDYQDIVDLSN